MEYKGKHILVLGAGESGIGAAHVLGSLGAKTVLNDYKEVALSEDVRNTLNDVGVEIIMGRQGNDLLNGVDRVIVSPGLSLEIPILQEALARHISIVGEVELAYEVCKAPILGITGTNGKTTTTTLLTEVMRGTDHPVLVGGNIGDSLSEAAFRAPAHGLLVAELSSYQLETIDTFTPHGAIVLNVTPDHLTRHKTMENYAACKANIFRNQTEHDFVVLNQDDPIVAAMAQEAHSQVLWISQSQPVDAGAYFAEGICYAVKDGRAFPVISQADIHIPGSHNIENILAVIALAYALGVSVDTIASTIKTFTGVEHRLERVATIDGVTYYNDSKATNVDSVVKALDAFDQPVILLAGGHDKLTPLDDFMQVVKVHTKELILMGEAADRFENAAKVAGITHIHRADSMKNAVQIGHDLASQGDIVLLSPACSSFDWYSCFEERGEDFKNVVKAMQEGK